MWLFYRSVLKNPGGIHDFLRNQDVKAPETTQDPHHITAGDKNRQNQTLLAVMLKPNYKGQRKNTSNTSLHWRVYHSEKDNRQTN